MRIKNSLGELRSISKDNRPLSFADISEFLGKHGLQSIAYSNAPISELDGKLDENTLAIVHLANDDQFHFIAISKPSAHVIRVDDYPRMGLLFSIDDFRQKFGSGATGNVMLVKKGGANFEAIAANSQNHTADAATGAAILQKVEEHTKETANSDGYVQSKDHIKVSTFVDLGKIEKESQTVHGKIIVENNSADTIEILNIKGTCSCFLGFDKFNPKIVPGAKQVIVVEFNPQKMQQTLQGEVVGQLVMQTSNEELKLVPILCKGSIVEPDWIIAPKKIDLGVISLKTALDTSMIVSVYARGDMPVDFKFDRDDFNQEMPASAGDQYEGAYKLVKISSFKFRVLEVGPLQKHIKIYDKQGGVRDLTIIGNITP